MKLVAILARYYHGNELIRPYEFAREVQAAGDLMGIRLSNETLADCFKQARQIIDASAAASECGPNLDGEGSARTQDGCAAPK